MAELERMKSDEKMYKAFANLQASTEKALGLTYRSVNCIEKSLTMVPGNIPPGAVLGD